MKKTIASILIALGFGLAVVYYVQTGKQPTPPPPRPSDDRAIPVRERQPAANPPAGPMEEDDFNQPAPEPSRVPAPVADGPLPTEEEPSDLAAMTKKLMQDPQMKQMMRNQQQATLDMFYADFFDYVNLPEAEMESLRELMVDRQMIGMEAGLEMLDQSEEMESMASAGERIRELQDAVNEQIQELLGEEAWAVFEEFEETQPERMNLFFFKQSLPASADVLTVEQEHELIVVMHEERTRSMEASRPTPGNTSSMEAAMGDYLDTQAALHERFLTRAEEILSPVQLDHFERSLERQRAMQEMGARMSGRMMKPAAE